MLSCMSGICYILLLHLSQCQLPFPACSSKERAGCGVLTKKIQHFFSFHRSRSTKCEIDADTDCAN